MSLLSPVLDRAEFLPPVGVLVAVRAGMLEQLNDVVESLVGQTYEVVEVVLVIDVHDQPSLVTAQQLALTYPENSITVSSCAGQSTPAMWNHGLQQTLAPVVMPITSVQPLDARAVEAFVGAFTTDPELGFVFSQPPVLGRNAVSLDDETAIQATLVQPRFECAAYVRDLLVGVDGFSTELGTTDTAWDVWRRLIDAGATARRIRHTVTRTEEIDSDAWVPESWAVLVQRHHEHFGTDRADLAVRIRQASTGPWETELLADVLRMLAAEYPPSVALPHLEALLERLGEDLTGEALAWLAEIQGRGLAENPHEAWSALRMAVQLAPGRSTTHAGLARLLHASGDHERALEHIEDAVELEPNDAELRGLHETISVRTGTERPYVVFYPGVENPQGAYAMQPILDKFRSREDIDATLLFRGQVRGVQGGMFNLAHARMNRRPDAIVVFRAWWGEERVVALAARSNGIPVIMLNHGAMFVRSDGQEYKQSLYPADVNCIWGWRDLELWRTWNTRDRFVVTGNPSHDLLQAFEPVDLDLPEEYALLLTPGHGRIEFQRNVLMPSARNLQAHMPVVCKCHPNDPHQDELSREFLTFKDEADLLFTLIYHASAVITSVTSALMPAMFFEKPIFLHGYDVEDYKFSDFRAEYEHVFNFKDSPDWKAKDIANAIRPTRDHYEHFAHHADGGNTQRVVDVIESTLQEARSWRRGGVVLPEIAEVC